MKTRTKYHLDIDLWPWPWKVHPRSKCLKYQGKLAKICLDIMHRASSIVGEVKGQGQGRAKGQIHLISYNLVTNCHRTLNLIHVLVYENPHQIWPWPWPLTLTLKSSPKVKIFETYQLLKTSQNMLGYYAQGIVYCWQGQRSRSRSSKRSISYNFASNCHRDLKPGSYFNLWKTAPNMTLTLTSDLDLEKFTQGPNFWNIN